MPINKNKQSRKKMRSPKNPPRLSGFKLAEGTAVTFRLYVDNLGAGALDVSMALSRWPWFQTTRLAMDKQPEMKRGFSVFYWSQLGALNDVVVSFKNEFPKKS